MPGILPCFNLIQSNPCCAAETFGLQYEKNMRVWNMSCGWMRASTVGFYEYGLFICVRQLRATESRAL